MKTLVCSIAILTMLLLGISLAAQEKKTSAPAGTQPASDLGITVRRLSPCAAVFKRNCARREMNSKEFETNRRS